LNTLGWCCFGALLCIALPFSWVPFICTSCRKKLQRPVYGEVTAPLCSDSHRQCAAVALQDRLLSHVPMMNAVCVCPADCQLTCTVHADVSLVVLSSACHPNESSNVTCTPYMQKAPGFVDAFQDTLCTLLNSQLLRTWHQTCQ